MREVEEIGEMGGGWVGALGSVGGGGEEEVGDDHGGEAVGGAGVPEAVDDFLVGHEGGLAAGAAGEHGAEVAEDVALVEALHEELGDDFAAGDEVDEGDVLDFDEEFEEEVAEGASLAAVADDLGDAEEGGLEGGGAGGDEGGLGLLEEAVGFAENDGGVVAAEEGGVVGLGHGGGAGDDELVLGEVPLDGEHFGKDVFEFLGAAPG